jgi:hypothetical protein
MSARRATKRAQDGSAGSVVVILALAVLVWWQWDWISGFVGSGGRAAPLDVVDYRCDRSSFDGTVRNASDAPVSVRAVTAVYDSSGKKSDYRESAVRPCPIQPGQSAGFRGETGVLPDAGYCKLDGFVDADTGKPVKHSGGRH